MSYVAKKINENFRQVDTMFDDLDYLSKWAALR